MNINYKLVGERIKSKRKECKKTQEQLAEEMGVSVGFISQLERGITKVNLENLGKLSEILDCDIAYFVSDAVKSKSEYLQEEFINAFHTLSDKERHIVMDLITSLTENRA